MVKRIKKKPKLVQNKNVVKLSREKSTVRAALQRALHDSFVEGWKKVLIIGMEGRYLKMRHTTEKDEVLLGMMELAKTAIYRDIL